MQTNVVQLRELLREKFPGVRMTAADPAEKAAAVWPTGFATLDIALGGGLPKGGITELQCAHRSCGSALVLPKILNQIAAANQIAVLIDGQDSFDPAGCAEAALRHLLWVRCRDAEQAFKAADVVLRDANLSFVVLDLALNSPAQLRKIPATTWFRFQRIVEQTMTTLLVVTPQKLVSGADARVVLKQRFNLNALDRTEEELLRALRVEGEVPRSGQRSETMAAEAG